MEAIFSSETSVASQQTTRRHILEDDTLHYMIQFKSRPAMGGGFYILCLACLTTFSKLHSLCIVELNMLVGIEVLSAVTMKITVSWDIMRVVW
jgi:hypothetical protein